MSAHKLLRLVFVLAVGSSLSALGRVTQASAFIPAEPPAGLPAVSAPIVAMDSDAAGPIIIDHTCTDLSQIPAPWLEEAKKLAFHFAHTSHGSQIISGITKLEQVNPTFGVAVLESGTVGLPGGSGVLRIYDGNNVGGGDTYITPELYWSTTDGISRTMSVADTGWFDYSMWSWCGQQSSNTEAQVQQYLDTMAAFETQYPTMKFILMTGHTDGGTATLARNNARVRQYAIDHDKVLFDFADIETYDPLGGGPYVNDGMGTCTWCADFCSEHPGYCTDLPDSCVHTDTPAEAKLFCKLKGNAFWWMMARLAGWEPDPTSTADLTDSTQTALPAYADFGERITYTVSIRGSANPLSNTVVFTDTLPGELHYVPGTLTATSGIPDDSYTPTLSWSGNVGEATLPVTITYAVTVTLDSAGTITNTAYIGAPGYGPIARTAVVHANWHRLYLPLVVREAPFREREPGLP